MLGGHRLYRISRYFACCVHVCVSNHIENDEIGIIFPGQGKMSISEQIYEIAVSEKLLRKWQRSNFVKAKPRHRHLSGPQNAGLESSRERRTAPRIKFGVSGFFGSASLLS